MSASWDKLHVLTPEQNIKIWKDTVEMLEKELTKNYFGPNPNSLSLQVGVVMIKYLLEKIKKLEDHKNKLDRI